MFRHFFTACAMIAVLFSVAGAENLYVGWQAAPPEHTPTISAHDLDTGALQSPTFDEMGKPQGVAVSPKNGDVYVAIETSAFYGVKAYDASTGAYLFTVFTGSSSKKVFGIAFDSYGNLYASLSNRNIAKIYADGTPTKEDWGQPAGETSYNAGDITVYGNRLYCAVPYGVYGVSSGGVFYYDLNVTGGNATWLTKYAGASVNLGPNGVAFAPDGTMYTAMLGGTREVRKWTGQHYKYEDSEVLWSFTGGGGILDIDYYDGVLYVMGNKTETGATVFRYDTTAANPTWQSFVTPPTGFGGSIGYIDIAPIPEPSTLVLLAGGLVGLLAYAWRRRR